MDLARGAPEPAPPAIGALRGGALGDFVLTLPAIAALRSAFPGHVLRLIGRPDYLRLARPDGLLEQDSAALAPLYAVRGTRPACLRTFFAGIRFFMAYNAGPGQPLAANLADLVPGEVLLHDPQPPPRYQAHIGEHLLAPLRLRGFSVPEPLPCLRLQPEDRGWAASCWADLRLGPGPVLVHPGSGGERKCWPLESFVRLASCLQRHGAEVLLLQGPVEAGRPLPSMPFPVLRPPGAMELASVLERAALFVGNDSGPGHLAEAVGRPTLSLFGPTDPRVWRPRGSCCRLIQAPLGRMEALGVDAVLAEAEQMLAQEPPVGLGPAEARGA